MPTLEGAITQISCYPYRTETKLDFADWLRSRGWDGWYDTNYWVKPDIINPELRDRIDYTNHGMSLVDAVVFELETYGL